ncbi:MAG TPA: hypothetical protein VLJ39_06430, partial [Tepidisphaeraceae bacterium]|nr:hypothetical protein [Tepidisphaeraceae bacterium]
LQRWGEERKLESRFPELLCRCDIEDFMTPIYGSKAALTTSVLAFLVLLAPSRCFAMMDIEQVTQERAHALGMEIRAHAAGPDLVRVELEFEAKGELKSYSRVDLESHDGGKLLLFASLREEPGKPGHILVSFAADRSTLDRFTLRVVTGAGTFDMSGYDIRVKDFVKLEQVH